MPARPLRLLVVEDSEDDAALLVRELGRRGFEPAFHRVASAEELSGALAAQEWDVVLADYVMPGFGGLEALRIVQRSGPDLPFIVVSGAIGEEVAVEAVKAGANDYLMKHNLARLGPAVERALAETALRRERREAEEALHRLVKAVETIEIGVTIADLEGRITYTNPADARMHGWPVAELIGREARLFAPPETWRPGPSSRVETIHGWRRESVNVRRDGSVFPVQLMSDAVPSPRGAAVGVVTCCIDITDRKRAEHALRASEERYRLLFERNLAGVYTAGLDGRLLECNEAFARIFGYASREEALAHPQWVFAATQKDREASMARLREQGFLVNFEACLSRRDGSPVWVLRNETLLQDGGDEPLVQGTLIDITDRKRAEEQVEYQAYHDTLTGLPNRALFTDRFNHAVAYARRTGQGLAALHLDLDHFKVVNDTLGHRVGDRLLQEMARRLRQCVREDDTVARTGGDEFSLLLSFLRQGQDAPRIAEKILQTIAEPARIEGHELYVTASVGVALCPEDGQDAETLLRNADRALYRAKESGRNNYQLCTPAMGQLARDRLALERGLRQAVERHELVVHYQPQLALPGTRVVGAEALVRWRHPERGLVLPAEFVPLAEDIGLIQAVGEWVLRQACAQARAWQDQGRRGLRVAVNLSARQFRQPGLEAAVERVLRETGLDPGRLELEITESIAMQNLELTVATLRAFVARGITIAIDDFGTGHSSLSYLKLLPIQRLKVDQSFVQGVGADPHDTAIVRAIVGMAHSLELKVTAEGVETEEQLRILEELGCDEVQGHLLSEPVPPDVLDERLRALRPPGFALPAWRGTGPSPTRG